MIESLHRQLADHGWQVTETRTHVTRVAREHRFTTITAVYKPDSIWTKVTLLVFVGPRSIRGGHVLGFSLDKELKDRFAVGSALRVYGNYDKVGPGPDNAQAGA